MFWTVGWANHRSVFVSANVFLVRKDSYNPVVKLQKDSTDSDIGEVLEEKLSDAVSVRRQAVRMKHTDTFMSACRSQSFWVWR